MKPVRIPSASFRMLTLVAVLAVLTGTDAAAQSSTSPASGAGQREARRRRVRAPSASTSAATLPTFYLLAFAGTLVHGKCMDFGPPPQVAGSPVFIYGCNGTVAQQVRVEEINDRHEVILHAGTKVIGIRNPLINTLRGAAPGGTAPTEFALELQKRVNSVRPDSANQIFALDGDSIILAHSRPCISTDASVCPPPPPQLVVQVQNARGANRSPLVVGRRNLADSEFWEFKASDGSDKDPTSGFTRVASRQNLLDAISAINNVAQNNGGAAWGSVIRILESAGPIDLSARVFTICDPAAYTCDIDGVVHDIRIPTGVTIRGDRRGVTPGPRLLGKYYCLAPALAYCEYTIFQITGDYVRITGLGLQGSTGCVVDPTGCYAIPVGNVHAIQIGWRVDQVRTNPSACVAPSNSACPEPTGIVVDHNEIFDWSEAVSVFDGSNIDYPSCDAQPDLTLNDRVHVDRNFIHHNEINTGGGGYGVVHRDGATSTILGNTFLMNRHAIAADGEPHEQYAAWFNLVLSNVPFFSEQDFDVHGSAPGSGHTGSFAGSEVDILWNTFLGGGRPNFELRGEPCSSVDRFSSNVSMNPNPLVLFDYFDNLVPPDGLPLPINGPVPSWAFAYVILSGNQYVSTNPATYRLGVGDFDGDGAHDLFLATGAAWYYSPHGQAEWRYLNGGKTDKIDSLLLGDFDGDGRTDVIGKNGNDLMISWGGVSDWQKINSISAPISDLAVGDFDGDGRADIFWADGTTWRVSSGGSASFNYVQTSRFHVKDLRFGHFSVCDFEGKGKTDVFGVVGGKWRVSCGATSSWTPLPVSLTDNIDGLVVADFDGNGRADIAAFSNPVVSRTIEGHVLIGVNVTDWNWAVSRDGAEDWTYHDITPTAQGSEPCALTFSPYQLPLLPQLPQQPLSAPASLLLVGVGRFSGNAGADILLWGDNFGNNFCIVPGGTGAAQRQSRQDMR